MRAKTNQMRSDRFIKAVSSNIQQMQLRRFEGKNFYLLLCLCKIYYCPPKEGISTVNLNLLKLPTSTLVSEFGILILRDDVSIPIVWKICSNGIRSNFNEPFGTCDPKVFHQQNFESTTSFQLLRLRWWQHVLVRVVLCVSFWTCSLNTENFGTLC